MRNPNCKLCPLHKEASFVCLWGEGPKTADLMIVGEAPGRDEDIAGQPFVGRAGKLLEYALDRLGISRKSVYITNTIKCRPPGNKLPTRKPDREELDVCHQTYLAEEILTIKPKAILLLGATAMEAVTGSQNIAHWQGRVFLEHRADPDISVVIAYHPAFVLRNRWREREFVVAVALAAGLAGLPTKVLPTGKLFDYEKF